MQFEVFLPLQHAAELDALLRAQQDPASPSYHKWLKPTEFEQRFGASAETRAAVKQELAAYGVTVTEMGSRGLQVSGSARAVGQVFSSTLVEKTAVNGTKSLAMSSTPAAPPALASSGAVVVGLSNTIRMRTQIREARQGRQPLQ